MKLLLSVLLMALMSSAHAERLVVAGSAVTEILYALGAGDRIVAVDSTSLWPKAATELPSIGYVRALSAEGVLALKPDNVLLSDEAGPPAAVAALTRAVKTNRIEPFSDPGVLPERVRQLSMLVGMSDEGERLAAQLAAQLAVLRQRSDSDSRSALVILAAGNRGMMVAGRDTAAQSMLDWIGLRNTAAALSGYKPFSREAMLALQPDVLVVAETEPGSFDLQAHPVLAASPAGRSGRVLVADATWLLGMGPRLPEVLQTVRSTADQGGAR